MRILLLEPGVPLLVKGFAFVLEALDGGLEFLLAGMHFRADLLQGRLLFPQPGAGRPPAGPAPA